MSIPQIILNDGQNKAQSKPNKNKKNLTVCNDNTIFDTKIPMAAPITPSMKYSYSIPEYPFKDIAKEKDYSFPGIPARSVDEVAEQTGLRKEFIQNVISMEGFKTKVYRDQKGIKTIGVGHNIEADKSYHAGNEISKEQAYTFLKNDLNKAENALDTLVDTKKLTSGQHEALVDIVFNVGKDKIKDSNLIKYINSGNYEMAVKEFNYICVGKKVNTHLCKRRMINLKSFSDGADVKSVYDAMTEIFNRGINDFKQKINEANNAIKRRRLEAKKEKFISEASGIIKDVGVPRY